MPRRAVLEKRCDSSDAGKKRLLSVKGDPFLLARWERVVFLHFMLEPETLRPQLRSPFELELYDGSAVISVVAITMRRFRPVRPISIAAWPFALISRQVFLNLRTYVRLGDEPGALFLWGWLSQPWRFPFPSGMFGLPYAFATLRCEHLHETGAVSGIATTPMVPGRFVYRAGVDARAIFVRCGPGTVGELPWSATRASFAAATNAVFSVPGIRRGCKCRLRPKSKIAVCSTRHSPGSRVPG